MVLILTNIIIKILLEVFDVLITDEFGSPEGDYAGFPLWADY